MTFKINFIHMKSSILMGAWYLLAAFSALAQSSISGTITNQSNGQSLAGASIVIENTYKAANSDYAGRFKLSNLKAGSYVLKVSYLGYETVTQSVELQGDLVLHIPLTKQSVLADEVVIRATNATAKSAIAYTNVSKVELNKQNLGQDLPILLNFTPSAVTTSDAGGGVGYTGIRIRGSDATRVNVTINGIPYNDAESQGSYFVDMPDIASSVNSIQIQRGVGTSTNGAAAFGATINIQTNALRKEPYAEINNSYGSFNTWKHTVMAGTGLIDGKFTVDARLSKITSDGFIDRASSDLKSFYLSGGYYGKKTTLRLNVFSGQEKTYQAWNGIPEARLRGDVPGMIAYAQRNFLSTADSLNILNSGSRTYNSFTYDNQTDNYQQDQYQFTLSQELSRTWQFNAALFYTKGKGYYEEYKAAEALSTYGISDVMIGVDTIGTSDIIRRKWLDNDFYGTTFSLNYDSQSKLTANIGGGWNQYVGKHYGEVIWSQYASDSRIRQRYYEDQATKTDFNLYAKAFYQFSPSLHAFADMQVRAVGYNFLGFNSQLKNVQQDASLPFFNPKVGLTYALTNQSSLYASFGIGNKEPNRDDYTQSSPESRPKAEHLRDLEAGYRLQTTRFSASANYFLMDYKNQLVLTGKLNDVGSYTRSNIPRSYRTGIELEAAVRLTQHLRWNANATFSANKVQNFREFVDDYDNGGQQENTYAKTNIAFSPSVIAGSQLTYEPVQHLSIALLSKYVGKQYLDNTSSESRKLNPYFTNDLRISYAWHPGLLKEINVSLLLNNVFDVKYESNGYTYGYLYGGQRVTENFYFPQAARNFLLAVGLKF